MAKHIDILPALTDNYIYILRNGSEAIVIDPSDAAVVEHFLTEHKLTLLAVLITHHHSDHVGGLGQLKEKYNPTVYAPKDGDIPFVDTIVHDGDKISIGAFTFSVIHTPGHTKGHVVYYDQREKVLFSGDTLFSGGCGKLLEGTAEDMYGSFLKLGELDPSTKVYCGHEYTRGNYTFAHAIEPNNTLVEEHLNTVTSKKCTMPFALRDEFDVNPYFRVDDDSLRSALGMSGASSTAVFAEIRRRKDSFTS